MVINLGNWFLEHQTMDLEGVLLAVCRPGCHSQLAAASPTGWVKPPLAQSTQERVQLSEPAEIP